MHNKAAGKKFYRQWRIIAANWCGFCDGNLKTCIVNSHNFKLHVLLNPNGSGDLKKLLLLLFIYNSLYTNLRNRIAAAVLFTDDRSFIFYWLFIKRYLWLQTIVHVKYSNVFIISSRDSNFFHFYSVSISFYLFFFHRQCSGQRPLKVKLNCWAIKTAFRSSDK